MHIGQIITGKWNGNKYEILNKLGEGGIGAVYKVKDIKGKIMALKISNDISSITREFNTLKKLENTVCVPKVYEIDDYQSAGTIFYFFVMDYVDGYNLKELINSSNIKLKDVLGIGIILLNILDKIYKIGYMYCDIKLENIMLDKNKKRIIFIDFGGAIEKQYGIREYTPAYNMLSWGVCIDKKYPQSLIFSVTMIMLSMITKHEFSPIAHSINFVMEQVNLLNIHPDIKKMFRKALSGGYNSIGRYTGLLKGSLKLCDNTDVRYKYKVRNKYNLIADAVLATGIVMIIAAIITVYI